MARYHRRGGFHRLMSISSVLCTLRLVCLGIFARLYFLRGAAAASFAALAISLPAAWAAHRLIHRCDLATRLGRTLEILADFFTRLLVLAIFALRWKWLRLPALALGLLALGHMIRRMCRHLRPMASI